MIHQVEEHDFDFICLEFKDSLHHKVSQDIIFLARYDITNSLIEKNADIIWDSFTSIMWDAVMESYLGIKALDK